MRLSEDEVNGRSNEFRGIDKNDNHVRFIGT